MSHGSRPTTIDLHRHVYGGIAAPWWLTHIAGRRINPGPYESAWLRMYDQPSPLRALLQRYQRNDQHVIEDFRRLFEFHQKDGPGFERFQLHHDLITWTSALADPQLLRRPTQRFAEELPLVIDHVAEQCRREGLGAAELRLMLPAGMRPAVARWAWALFSHCCGQASTTSCRIDGIASLSRSHAVPQWRDLADCLRAGEAGGIVGVDFSHREERSRIQDLLPVSEQIHAFNAQNPRHAVALVVHVGESYEGICLESALRRIHQAVRLLRPHRIGHAVAAGIAPQHHGVHERSETVRERLEHLTWECEHADSLTQHGIAVDTAQLRHERSTLLQRDPRQRLRRTYDHRLLEEFSQRQQWLRHILRRQQQIIEVCPTSTQRIAGIRDHHHHHVHAFLDEDLTVVLGSDDPGLFATTLSQECALVEQWRGEDCRHLTERVGACSRYLSGRDTLS